VAVNALRGLAPSLTAQAAAKTAFNWITGELFRLMKGSGVEIGAVRITPDHLADLLSLVDAGTISGTMGKTVLEEMFATGRPAGDIVHDKGLNQISDEDRLAAIAAQVIRDNPQAVADYLGGKEGVIRFLVGQVMKATQGQANPGLANRVLAEKLKELTR